MQHNNSNPVISIAIPTFNRSANLKLTLDSIIIQDLFIESYNFEIVISDNCSSDDTTDVVKQYLKLFPGKIKYYRNDFNNVDLNFETVLKKCNGQYLKLNNDTLVHEPNSLRVLLSTIEKHLDTKPIILFTTGRAKTKNFIFNNINEFILNVSYLNTWIACFGIWKSDLDKIQHFSRYSNLKLIQTDVLCRLIDTGSKVCINNEYIYKSIEPSKKGGYNFVEIFLTNYSKILSTYVEKNQLDKKIYNIEIRKILLSHILYSLANIYISPDKLTYVKYNSFTIINNYLKNNLKLLIYFYCKFILYCIYRINKICLIRLYTFVSKIFTKTDKEITIQSL